LRNLRAFDRLYDAEEPEITEDFDIAAPHTEIVEICWRAIAFYEWQRRGLPR